LREEESESSDFFEEDALLVAILFGPLLRLEDFFDLLRRVQTHFFRSRPPLQTSHTNARTILVRKVECAKDMVNLSFVGGMNELQPVCFVP